MIEKSATLRAEREVLTKTLRKGLPSWKRTMYEKRVAEIDAILAKRRPSRKDPSRPRGRAWPVASERHMLTLARGQGRMRAPRLSSRSGAERFELARRTFRPRMADPMRPEGFRARATAMRRAWAKEMRPMLRRAGLPAAMATELAARVSPDRLGLVLHEQGRRGAKGLLRLPPIFAPRLRDPMTRREFVAEMGKTPRRHFGRHRFGPDDPLAAREAGWVARYGKERLRGRPQAPLERLVRKGFARKPASVRRFEVTRIRLSSQGYTSGGRYYGTGAPLFAVYDRQTGQSYELRAPSAQEARRRVVIEGPESYKYRSDPKRGRAR